ncbi:transposase [Leisingera sp. F5]|uniref:transposase n=1 Tax=Leisingera sp. F5 TaxID=1813816 RepID=UPI00345C0844
MNTKLHAVTDASGRPIRFFMTAGQVSDYTGARALLRSLPAADWMIADRGYDADWHPGCLERQGDTSLHPRQEVAWQTRSIRQAQVQAAQPHRDHVRPIEGLAACRHPLRQMSENLPLSHRARRRRHLLALKLYEAGT